MIKKIIEIDKNIVFYLQNTNFPTSLTVFFKFITILGDYGFIWWFLSGILIFFGGDFYVFGLRLLLGTLLIIFLGEILLKHIFRRNRPFLKYKEIFSIALHTPKSFSFPSGHTSMSVMAILVLFQIFDGFNLFLLFFVGISIILSRLFLRVHYFSDIIGGIFLGLFVGFFVNFIV